MNADLRSSAFIGGFIVQPDCADGIWDHYSGGAELCVDGGIQCVHHTEPVPEVRSKADQGQIQGELAKASKCRHGLRNAHDVGVSLRGFHHESFCKLCIGAVCHANIDHDASPVIG